jgi:hypothetical protein
MPRFQDPAFRLPDFKNPSFPPGRGKGIYAVLRAKRGKLLAAPRFIRSEGFNIQEPACAGALGRS